MNDDVNKTLVFGSQILALILVLAGSVLQRDRLRTARPQFPGGQVSHDPGSGHRHARLWEDPLKDFQTFAPKGRPADSRSEELSSTSGDAVEESTKTGSANPAATPGSDANNNRQSQMAQSGEGARKADQAILEIRARPQPRDSKPEATNATEDVDLVLWNVVDARPTPEAKEGRLRARYAVVSTLAAAGYQPVFDSSLASVQIVPPLLVGRDPAPPVADGSDANGKSEQVPRLVVGYLEAFRKLSDSAGTQDATSDIPQLILLGWSPIRLRVPLGGQTPPGPIDTPDMVKEIIDQVAPSLGFRTCPSRTVVIHHGNSNHFSDFLTGKYTKAMDDQVLFVRATAPPANFKGIQNKAGEDLSQAARRLQAVVPDDQLIKRLVSELKLRIPALSGRLANRTSNLRIVVFTESDGVYGHNLKKLVEAELKDAAEVRIYTYLRGLDGLPQESQAEKPARIGSPLLGSIPTRLPAGATERSWGTSQYDYLRRLAGKLREQHRGESPIAAIGVLGSDVYDKLLVLQALHPELPGVTYFTTDLDSLFLSSDYLPFTRNLVVSSGEGLDPSDVHDSPWVIPPMRDSYQTALARTIHRLICPQLEHDPTAAEARIWEIGIGSHVALPAAVDEVERPVLRLVSSRFFNPVVFLLGLLNALLIFVAVSSRTTINGEACSQLTSSARWYVAVETITTGVLLFGLAALIVVSLVPDPKKLGFAFAAGSFVLMVTTGLRYAMRRRRNREKRWMRPNGLEGGTMAAAGILAVVAYAIHRLDTTHMILFAEPISILSGVAIWPSILLRLTAFFVGLLLLAFTSRIIIDQGMRVKQALAKAAERDENCVPSNQAGASDANLPRLKLGRGDSTISGRLLRLLDSLAPPFSSGFLTKLGLSVQSDSSAAPADRLGLGSCLSHCFDPARRLRRVILTSAIYFCVSLLLFIFWSPTVPARGGAAFLIEKLTLSAGVGLYIVHLSFCVDLHLCACEFVGTLRAWLTEDSKTQGQPSMDACSLRRVASAVGLLTRAVGVTLLYPLTILSLLLLSRLRLFDDWTMTPSLILTFLFGALVLIVVAVMIVLASRRFRQQVKTVLGRQIAALEDAKHRRAMEEAVGADKKEDVEIKLLNDEAEKLDKYREGAFAPWYSQPIFVATMAAIAIVGSLGLAESLIAMFVG